MIKIDEVDAKILRALIKDARSKLTEIAEDCKLSSTAIKNRIERLKESGLIAKAFLLVNMASFGYSYVVLIGVNLDLTKENEVIELIRKHTKVAGIDHTIGKYDLCLFVFAKNIDELDQLKYVLRKQKGVTNIEINIWNKLHLYFEHIKLQNMEV